MQPPPPHPKQLQRDLARSRLKVMTDKDREIASRCLIENIHRLPILRRLQPVAGFYPLLKQEPDLRPYWQSILDRGLPLIMPSGADNLEEISLWRVPHLDAFRPTQSGVMEPDPAQCQPIPFSEPKLIFVPGIAFNASGARLGRGKGYYDRLLPRLRQTTYRVGVFFSCQEIEDLYTEPHDAPLDLIITDQSIHLCSI
ncbi:MAG: 5-formyltetrahydrofolate cyclo-ligase [Methylacidiphilales bacterium]|nr:5-formyltetrahydrofolate cyclo-ligase [Candidatus Methylacidiphilales bacterium]MDW8349996.1 5-formyltetrahydrofolate cyclo-ligase [Verrucomicrobiae bacterium]